MSGFQNELHVKQLGDNWRLWELTEDLVWKQNGDTITVPKGFVCDGASIPQFLWGFLPTWGRYARAAALHDYLYDCLNQAKPHGLAQDRRRADLIFMAAMADLEVEPWVAFVMWAAVRIGGGSRALRKLAGLDDPPGKAE